MSHNIKYCKRRNKACPCLTCANDSKVNDPETDTKCCDLIGHRAKCREEDPCPDYEPEAEDAER